MQHFTASDGARIAFQDRGSGRPLVLLHGLMAHSGFFAPQHELAADFRLISIDLRGHGESDGQTATIEQLAWDVETLLRLLSAEEAIGIGWSLGAAILWQMLAGPSAPRFSGAVIVDMTPRVLNQNGWDLGLPSEMVEARRIAIRQDFRAMAAAAGQAMFAQPIRDDLQATADWASAEFAHNDPAAIGQLWDSLVAKDYRPALAAMHQPTLVIHGAHSQLYGPGTATYLVAALPDARAVRFDRSGHAPHLEQPQLFNRTIRNFAAGLNPGRQDQRTVTQA